jgi:hypothetical protein
VPAPDNAARDDRPPLAAERTLAAALRAAPPATIDGIEQQAHTWSTGAQAEWRRFRRQYPRARQATRASGRTRAAKRA